MKAITRRECMMTLSAATLAAALPDFAATPDQRVFVGSNTAEGILAFDWNPASAELKPAGVAAKLPNVDWIAFSPDRQFLFAACEVDSFNGKPTGEVASLRVEKGNLSLVSAQNSASKGTCYVALDHTGKMLLAADYGGGSASGFRVAAGMLTPVWNEHYTERGPNKERQEAAHAHFVSFSPDNHYAYINDLGGDRIHIYRLNAGAGELVAAGAFHSRPGAGPRTLRFHPNGHTAYSMNELDSTVDILNWNPTDGSLELVRTVELLPPGYTGDTHGCDTVISKNGRHVYFANRGNNSIYLFQAERNSGNLTPSGRFDCGGKTPRSFLLDPTERWMFVANQDSGWISIFARDPETGALAARGKNVPAGTPMCILFA